jgi:hypothetical protein
MAVANLAERRRISLLTVDDSAHMLGYESNNRLPDTVSNQTVPRSPGIITWNSATTAPLTLDTLRQPHLFQKPLLAQINLGRDADRCRVHGDKDREDLFSTVFDCRPNKSFRSNWMRHKSHQ